MNRTNERTNERTNTLIFLTSFLHWPMNTESTVHCWKWPCLNLFIIIFLFLFVRFYSVSSSICQFQCCCFFFFFSNNNEIWKKRKICSFGIGFNLCSIRSTIWFSFDENKNLRKVWFTKFRNECWMKVKQKTDTSKSERRI